MSATPLSISESGAAFDRLALYPKLALAVSGGPDSLALLHLAAAWRAARGEGPELHVLTVDHGLRAASREEALMVGRLASALGLPHAILEWERQGERHTALQARARAARYDLMVAYCHAHDIPALATAHTLDDQAETFLMRLKRGSGLDGLAAIPMTGAWSGIAVERPLLDVAKARLIATLRSARRRLRLRSEQFGCSLRTGAGEGRSGSACRSRSHGRGARALGAAFATCARGARSSCRELPCGVERGE